MNGLICAYCGKVPRGKARHLCARKKESLRKMDEVINGIHAQMKRPGIRPLTSDQMKQRADRLRQMANGVKMRGGKVQDAYR
jgi:hypothetical protein